jgi:release factor glutamine methyltransferase
LDLIKEQGAASAVHVADVGTGSGIIAICAAKHASCGVTAIDISSAALGVARANAEALGVAERIQFVESDLFADVPVDERFEFIASNPPYISSREMTELAASVRDFEPKLALEAGAHGTAVIERLIPQAAERLKPGATLLMEISPMIASRVRQLLEQDGRFEVRGTIKDSAGLLRVVEARRMT